MGVSATTLPRRSTGDALADREDVGHAVADQDHGHALLGEAPDQTQDLFDLAHADRGGGLIQQQELCLRETGARDGHSLALPPGHGAH